MDTCELANREISCRQSGAKPQRERPTTIRKEYIGGEIPSMEAPRPAPAGDDIVYSPNNYRETEGIKES